MMGLLCFFLAYTNNAMKLTKKTIEDAVRIVLSTTANPHIHLLKLYRVLWIHAGEMFRGQKHNLAFYLTCIAIEWMGEAIGDE